MASPLLLSIGPVDMKQDNRWNHESNVLLKLHIFWISFLSSMTGDGASGLLGSCSTSGKGTGLCLTT